ncbi:MAG: hypothetical protein V8Q84_11715 [Bilophila sp.]
MPTIAQFRGRRNGKDFPLKEGSPHAPHEALASAIAEVPIIPSAHAPYGMLASSIPETPINR